VLISNDQGRAIVIDLPGGAALGDHQVHEGAWIAVIDGEVALREQGGAELRGRPGDLLYLDPRERHELEAIADARVLLLLTPWPGDGHPGAMTLEQKADVRRRASQRAGG
jgi:quercetin dioxygenase-like cupin family protein